MEPECTAEIDLRDLDTPHSRESFRVFTEKEALKFRVGMRVDHRFVEAVWFFPDTLSRDYCTKLT